MFQARDEYWMSQALALAKRAQSHNEVPIGAVLVHNDNLIGQGHNQTISCCDPSAHAEIVALRCGAKALKNYRLLQTTLYVTLEPCAMCVGALVQARIRRLVFAAVDKRAGAVMSVFRLLSEPRLNHRVDWDVGVMQGECSSLLQAFFAKRRLDKAL